MTDEHAAGKNADLQARLSKLSPEQRAALEKLMQQKGIDASRLSSASARDIPRQERGGDFPLSFGQQRMWFVDQFGTGLQIHGIFRVRGRLHFTALEKALDHIVERHEVLRTTYHRDDDGATWQRIRAHAPFKIQIVDLRELSHVESQLEVERLEQEQIHESYNLEQSPLLRASVFRITDEENVFLVNVAHIAFDGWSWGVFIQELGRLYGAFCAGESSPLPVLPVQYADYAVWERGWLSGPVLEKQLDFWKQHLEGLPVLELPTDTGQVSEQGAPGLVRRWALPDDLADSLRALNQANDATMFMTLLAAYAVLLHRYSGQQDIVIGCPVANRSRPELEGLIGCFMNPLPFRIDLGGNPTFVELLKRVRSFALQVFENQNTPFDMLVKTFAPLRDVRIPPLFQVMFLLQNISEEPPPLGDLDVEPFRARSGRTDEADHLLYQVALQVSDPGTGLLGQLEYANEYRSYLAQAPEHFQTLLTSIVADPDVPIGRLEMLGAQERSRILGEWACQRQDFDTTACVHRLFERQAEASPADTAVVCGDRRLRYDELNRQANRLANALIARGVGWETIVGIMLDRTPEIAVAVLAVMKAGGAYVPLDPEYPEERLRFIMADTGMPLLISRERVISGVVLDASLEVLDIDRPDADAGDSNPAVEIDPSRLVYVIHTSGSTGRPKGTMVTHAALANAYHAWEQAYDLAAGVRSHLQMASMSFDVFTGDLVRALCSGGKLVIADRTMLLEPKRLYQLMRDEDIDCAEFVPAVFRGLAEYLAASGLSLDFMKRLILGSDAWYVDEYRRAQELCGAKTRLVNSYGVTEATIDSTWFEGDVSGLPDGGQVPIGRPFPNTEVYVLDPRMQPVPVGVPGELWIGGPGLARGYLNHDELTAERFVSSPFSDRPDARLYRSGDLARFMADGNLELMGRADHQVKIRGFRVETGEIETLLSGRGDVRECVVVLREDKPGEKRLVAYCVPADGAELSPVDLRKAVAGQLPDYMVPAAFVQLDELPLTPNRKIDRKALPQPDADRQTEAEYVAPASETEQAITRIWQQVLQMDKIGIHDNFFDLGGHSLLVLQVHKKLRDSFQQEIPIVQLFEYPTIASLAKQLRQEPASASSLEGVSARAEKQKSAALQRKHARQRARRSRPSAGGSER